MMISKFGRATAVLSAIWIVASIAYLWPDEDVLNQAEWIVFDYCMGPINDSDNYSAASRRIESMIDDRASPDQVREHLRLLGFSDDQMQFADSVFLDPGEGGFFGSPAALEGARLNKVGDCQEVGERSRVDAMQREWINVAKSTVFGLLSLLAALFVGRAATRWILRGK